MKTKSKKILLAFALLCSLSIKIASAQTTATQPLSFNIGLDAGVPVGTQRTSSNFALGITPGLQYDVGSNFRLTFTTGFYNYFSKTERVIINPGIYYAEPGTIIAGFYTFKSNNTDIVPIKAGVKYLFAGNWYYGLELGASIVANNGGGGAALDVATGFGYILKNWDFCIRAEEFRNQGNGCTIFARTAYSFK
jgi:hypothetical protein